MKRRRKRSRPRMGINRSGGSHTVQTSRVSLYRTVSENEFRQIMSTGVFRGNHGTFEDTKWFAETPEHAMQWMERLNQTQNLMAAQKLTRIIEVQVERVVADRFPRFPNHDMIGPARFAGCNELRGAIIREYQI